MSVIHISPIVAMETFILAHGLVNIGLLRFGCCLKQIKKKKTNSERSLVHNVLSLYGQKQTHSIKKKRKCITSREIGFI